MNIFRIGELNTIIIEYGSRKLRFDRKTNSVSYYCRGSLKYKQEFSLRTLRSWHRLLDKYNHGETQFGVYDLNVRRHYES